jgi:hypothetical protein
MNDILSSVLGVGSLVAGIITMADDNAPTGGFSFSDPFKDLFGGNPTLGANPTQGPVTSNSAPSSGNSGTDSSASSDGGGVSSDAGSSQRLGRGGLRHIGLEPEPELVRGVTEQLGQQRDFLFGLRLQYLRHGQRGRRLVGRRHEHHGRRCS